MMAMAEEVRIKLKASLGMDAADVSKAMTAIQQQVQAKAGTPSETDTLKYVNQWLQKVMGASTSYVEQRKKLIASYREELKLVKELESEFAKSEHGKSVSTGDANADLAVADARAKAREKQITDARAFTKRLREEIDVRTADEAQGGTGGGGLMGGGLAGWALKKAPIIATIAAGIMVGRMLKAKADEWSEMSETLDIGFANLGRRMGKGTGLRGTLEPGGLGHVADAFKRLGYSGSDVLKMGEAYSIPGSAAHMNTALLAQGGFARAFGFGQNPEEIAGLGRRATQLGIAEPAQQPAFWRMMTEAVTRGNKAGIDASEAMRSLLSLTEDQAGMSGVVSMEMVAGLSGLQQALEGGSSRFFKGEMGAENIKSVLGSFTNPSSIAQERFQMNSIMGQFGGRMPSGKELDLTGDEERTFNAFSDVQKNKFIQQSFGRFAASKNPKLKYMLGNVAQDFGRAAGGDATQEQLLLQARTGLEGTKLMEANLAMRQAAGKTGKGVGIFGVMSQLFDKGGAEAQKALAGEAAPSGVTTLETKQQATREAQEGFSSAVSDSSLQLRTFIEQLKEAGARALAETEKMFHGGGTATPQRAPDPMTHNYRDPRARGSASRPSQLGTVGP